MKRPEKIFIVLAVSLLLFSAADLFAAQKPEIDESLRKGETRNILDPMMFSEPQVREAYNAAKKIPWILDSIYCYCRCKESPVFKHKSLLSCYVDDHASQ